MGGFDHGQPPGYSTISIALFFLKQFSLYLIHIINEQKCPLICFANVFLHGHRQILRLLPLAELGDLLQFKGQGTIKSRRFQSPGNLLPVDFTVERQQVQIVDESFFPF